MLHLDVSPEVLLDLGVISHNNGVRLLIPTVNGRHISAGVNPRGSHRLVGNNG